MGELLGGFGHVSEEFVLDARAFDFVEFRFDTEFGKFRFEKFFGLLSCEVFYLLGTVGVGRLVEYGRLFCQLGF